MYFLSIHMNYAIFYLVYDMYLQNFDMLQYFYECIFMYTILGFYP